MDEQTYLTWVEQYSDDLYRFAFWLCKDPDWAQDLVQDTFLRAWRSKNDLQDSDKVKAWLLVITRREFYRGLEKKRDHDDLNDHTHIPSDSHDPQYATEQDAIRQLILNLADQDREILAMHMIYGYSGDEIAHALSLSTSAVNTRLSRCRQRIKQKWSAMEMGE